MLQTDTRISLATSIRPVATILRSCQHWPAWLVAISLVMPIAGCLTNGDNEATYGVQPGQEGFVPARIAILPCQKWPASTPYKGWVAPTLPEATLAAVCERFDREVLLGFERQPYMKGFSPKYVKKALETAGQGDLIKSLPTVWTPPAPGCSVLEAAPICYKSQISNLPSWSTWLEAFSTATRHADAVLIPLITLAGEERTNDRGLEIAERRISIDLLLVSTNRGELLWAGGRTVRDSKKRLAGEGPLEGLPYPEWEELLSLVFNATLWRDFPGRQVL